MFNLKDIKGFKKGTEISNHLLHAVEVLESQGLIPKELSSAGSEMSSRSLLKKAIHLRVRSMPGLPMAPLTRQFKKS